MVQRLKRLKFKSATKLGFSRFARLRLQSMHRDAFLLRVPGSERVRVAREAVTFTSKSGNKRKLIGVFIGDKKMYFYQSSGKNSGTAGKWLPAAYLEIQPSGIVDYIRKIEGSWAKGGGVHHYPAWVEAISAQINGLMRRRLIRMRKGAEEFLRYYSTLEIAPDFARAPQPLDFASLFERLRESNLSDADLSSALSFQLPEHL